MTSSNINTDEVHHFRQLMQDGKHAYERGKKQIAHDLWREAAMLDPYNEGVWLALLKVLDQRADRIVCLNNILAINPTNVHARQLLRKLEQPPRRKKPARKRPSTFRIISWGLFSLILFIAAGLCFGAALSLFMQGL